MLYEPLCGHTDRITSLSFSSGGKILVSAANDHTMRPWNCQTGKSNGGLVAYNPESTYFTSPDGKVIASVHSVDETIRLWDTQTLRQIGEPLLGHGSRIRSLTFSQDNSTLASCAYDGKIRLWDSNTGSCIHCPLKGGADEFSAVALSPDGNILASGSWRGAIQL